MRSRRGPRIGPEDRRRAAQPDPQRSARACGVSRQIGRHCATADRRLDETRNTRERRSGKGACQAGRSASLERSSLRSDCPAVLGLVARRRTHCVRCAHCVQTAATSQIVRSALRARPRALRSSAPEAAPHGPARTHLCGPTRLCVFCSVRTKTTTGGFAAGGARRGRFRGRGAAQGRGRRAQRASSSDSSRLFERSAANAVSSATRARTEQRSAVGAQRRPPRHEPSPGSRLPRRATLRESGHLRAAKTAASELSQLRNVSRVAGRMKRGGAETGGEPACTRVRLAVDRLRRRADRHGVQRDHRGRNHYDDHRAERRRQIDTAQRASTASPAISAATSASRERP